MKQQLPNIEGFRFRAVKKITKGMSGDKKYYLDDDRNSKYLLRLSDPADYIQKQAEFSNLELLYKSGLPVPQPIAFGRTEEAVYTLLSWIDGEEAEKLLPKLPLSEQYAYGVKSGKILKQIHDCCPVNCAESWQTRYFSVMNERLAAYQNEGIPFDGSDKVLDFLDRKKQLLSTRPQTRHHGDYHMGNMIIGKDGILSVIDWHTVDFDNFGDPWYEFNRIGVENPAFATGQIDGYFENNIPEEFWDLLAFYLAGSAITSIVWAKYFAPDKLQEILNLNMSVVRWFDGMTNPVPTWYDENLKHRR